MNTESKTVGVPIRIPVLIPSQGVMDEFEGKLPTTMQFLVDKEFMTHEEAIAFLHYRTTITEVANSTDEFLAIYRDLKEQLAKKETGLILPDGY